MEMAMKLMMTTVMEMVVAMAMVLVMVVMVIVTDPHLRIRQAPRGGHALEYTDTLSQQSTFFLELYLVLSFFGLS